MDEDEDCFAVMLPDDVIEPTAAMSEMIRVRKEHGGSVLLAVEVDPAHVSSYGVFDVERTEDDWVKKVVGMVEKPAVEDAPSNLVATGRYLLDRAIFDALRRIEPGKGGELQLTDAIDLLISGGGIPFTSSSMMASAMTLAIPLASFQLASSLAFATPSMAQHCLGIWKHCWKNTDQN